MGFIQNLLQNAQQGTNSPMQSAQSRFGQSGLLESLRNMQGPTQNLPTNRQASQGGSAPFGGGLGGGIQGIMEQLRSQLGQQGLGGGLQPQGGPRDLSSMIQTRGPNGQTGYQTPEGARMFGTGSGTPTTGQWNPRMPTPQIPQMPRFPSPTSTGIPWQPGVGFPGGSPIPGGQPPSGGIPTMPQKPPSTTPMINPRPGGTFTLPNVGGTRTNPTYTGGGFATGDPQPTQPQQPTQTQSRYGSLSGIQRPTTLRR